MFGYTFFEILMVILPPIVYFLPTWIAVFRNIDGGHMWACLALNILCAFLPYPFWAIPLLVSVMPKSVIGKLWPLDK